MSKSLTKMTPIAVFDISSGSVAGAHALVHKSHNQHSMASLLASSRSFTKPKEDLDIKRFVDNTLEQMDAVIAKLHKADNHKPKEIHVLLSSPWFISQTRNIVYSKNSQFVCNQKLIDSLVEKEVAYMIAHDMERFGPMGKEGVIIEKQISQIKLNGYKTRNPFGKKTISLEISLVITISPKQIIDLFKDHLNKGYSGAKIAFSTSSYASFVSLRDFLTSPEELLILDIGEEVTDIAFVKNELFVYQSSFPVGFYELYRKLALNSNSTLEETRALIETFYLGKLSAEMTSNTEKVFEDFRDIWNKELESHIGNNAYSIKLPENIYISSISPFSSFFKKCIEQNEFIKHSSGSSNVIVTILNSSLFSKDISSLDPEEIDDAVCTGTLFASRLL